MIRTLWRRAEPIARRHFAGPIRDDALRARHQALLGRRFACGRSTVFVSITNAHVCFECQALRVTALQPDLRAHVAGAGGAAAEQDPMLRGPNVALRGRNPALDGLRGVAALIVVFGHTLSGLPIDIFKLAAFFASPFGLMVNGDAAVHVFFVLSGLVLG